MGHVRLRSIKTGCPAIGIRLHIGKVARCNTVTCIHDLEGRQTNALGSSMKVSGAHDVGRNYHAPGCMYNPPLPRIVRIVYDDVRKVNWCSICSVACHSFSWPRKVREAKGIARTLFSNRCNWADVLVVRGRCFGSRDVCFRPNRALQNLR